ncbi:MAG: transposase [Pseudomonadota bacterium]
MEDQRRSLSREFALEAVRLVTEGGLSLAQASRDLGIRGSVLGRWKKQLAPGMMMAVAERRLHRHPNRPRPYLC